MAASFHARILDEHPFKELFLQAVPLCRRTGSVAAR